MFGHVKHLYYLCIVGHSKYNLNSYLNVLQSYLLVITALTQGQVSPCQHGYD